MITGSETADAEVGALRHIDSVSRLAALQSVSTGDTFTLGLPIFHPDGDPVGSDNFKPVHIVLRDWSDYLDGRAMPLQGGLASVNDAVMICNHGTTHVDALGHVIVDGVLGGGRPATDSVGGLQSASVAALGERGVFTRAVIADVAGLLGVDHLPRRHHITFEELTATLQAQNVEVRRGDVLIIHTGSLKRFYGEGRQAYFTDYSEPGLSFEPELVGWFDRTGISGLGTDTLANELPYCPALDAAYPLHRYLSFDLGIIFHEALWLDDAVRACSRDRRWTGLYVCSPLKMRGASGSPVNPMFIR